MTTLLDVGLERNNHDPQKSQHSKGRHFHKRRPLHSSHYAYSENKYALNIVYRIMRLHLVA